MAEAASTRQGILWDIRECCQDPNLCSIIAYCLVVIVQEELKLEMETYDVLRILNTTLLTKMSLVDLLNSHASLEQDDERYIQLELKFED